MLKVFLLRADQVWIFLGNVPITFLTRLNFGMKYLKVINEMGQVGFLITALVKLSLTIEFQFFTVENLSF